MKRILGVMLGVGVVGMVACRDATTPAGPDEAASSRTIPGRYIVVFRGDVADVPAVAQRLVSTYGGTLRFTYQHAIQGFAADLPDAVVPLLQRLSSVAYIEQDAEVELFTTQNPTPSWGLDRIDQRNLPLASGFTYSATGSGVTAYIIDTGILLTHTDFGGQATFGFDALGGNGIDCHGHGTHVAGTVGGTSYGVAKDVALKAVRVLNCSGSGTNSQVMAGVDFVTADHVSGPAVANMSLGGSFSSALNTAVTNSINDGVTYAIAAGNGNIFGIPQNACNVSPASVGAALTVGATDISDREASFSNYGTCVDLLAPGVSITSAWIGSNTATATISGTSMATPHVAGVAALYLQGNPSATPAAVASAITGNTTNGAIKLHRRSRNNGTPNKLLFTSY